MEYFIKCTTSTNLQAYLLHNCCITYIIKNTISRWRFEQKWSNKMKSKTSLLLTSLQILRQNSFRLTLHHLITDINIDRCRINNIITNRIFEVIWHFDTQYCLIRKEPQQKFLKNLTGNKKPRCRFFS